MLSRGRGVDELEAVHSSALLRGKLVGSPKRRVYRAVEGTPLHAENEKSAFAIFLLSSK